MVIQNNTTNYNYKNMNNKVSKDSRVKNNPQIQAIIAQKAALSVQLGKVKQQTTQTQQLQLQQKNLQARQAEVKASLQVKCDELCSRFKKLSEQYYKEINKVFPNGAVHLNADLNLTPEQVKQLNDFNKMGSEYIQKYGMYQQKLEKEKDSLKDSYEIYLKMLNEFNQLEGLIACCSGIVDQILSSEELNNSVGCEEDWNALARSMDKLNLINNGEEDVEGDLNNLGSATTSEDEEDIDDLLANLPEEDLYDPKTEIEESAETNEIQQDIDELVASFREEIKKQEELEKIELEKELEQLEAMPLSDYAINSEENPIEEVEPVAAAESATPAAAATWGDAVYYYTAGPLVSLASSVSSWYYKA